MLSFVIMITIIEFTIEKMWLNKFNVLKYIYIFFKQLGWNFKRKRTKSACNWIFMRKNDSSKDESKSLSIEIFLMLDTKNISSSSSGSLLSIAW